MTKDILAALFDSQSSEATDQGYATTQCDSTQADSEGGAKALEPIDVCTTDEDVDTTASEGGEGGESEDALNPRPYLQQYQGLGTGMGIFESTKCLTEKDMEDRLRHLLGLHVKQSLHPPAPRIFQRQVEAISYLEALVANGKYKVHQLGLFSREFTTTGCRNFLVDTHAGFALSSSPRSLQKPCMPCGLLPRHLYEIFLEQKPCWLYFDLEFSRVENPDLQPEAVASAFLELLNQFCARLGLGRVDKSSLYDLDSTNSEKFSKHIVIKALESGETLCFPNNAQAGCLVKHFMDFVRQEHEAIFSCLANVKCQKLL